jgi:hypothetical protein
VFTGGCHVRSGLGLVEERSQSRVLFEDVTETAGHRVKGREGAASTLDVSRDLFEERVGDLSQQIVFVTHVSIRSHGTDVQSMRQ